MNIAINNGYFKKRYESDVQRDELETARLCKKGGFSLLDCSPDYLTDDNWQEKAEALAQAFKEEGITVEQSHAPFNRYDREPAEIFKEKLSRSFIIASIIGAKRIVIHADEYSVPAGEYVSEDACRFAYDYFAPLVELASKLGIGVAVENLFEDGMGGKYRSRCTSTTEEILRILELFNDPIVTCCWDFGHAAVAFKENMLGELKKVGKYVTCTHVHDNYLYDDLHLPLFLGKIDWKSHIEYLREINYPGAFTFECVYGTIPEPSMIDFLKYQHNAAEYLVNGGISE